MYPEVESRAGAFFPEQRGEKRAGEKVSKIFSPIDDTWRTTAKTNRQMGDGVTDMAMDYRYLRFSDRRTCLREGMLFGKERKDDLITAAAGTSARLLHIHISEKDCTSNYVYARMTSARNTHSNRRQTHHTVDYYYFTCCAL